MMGLASYLRKRVRGNGHNNGPARARKRGTVMSIDESSDGHFNRTYIKRDSATRRHRVIVTLSEEQMAAAEGWRVANGIAEQSEALGELVRLGLLSEIAKIYRLVSDKSPPPASGSRNGSGGRGFNNSDHSA